VQSEALRHLGIAAHGAGRLEVARQRLEESTRLRREIGLLPGAAANMVGLAYIAAAQQRSNDALALLDEASAIAGASQAHRILRQVSQARAELSDQHTRRPPDLRHPAAPNGGSARSIAIEQGPSSDVG